MLALEQRALLAMQASNFAAAGGLLHAMVGILDRFPTLLRDCKPSLHLLIGGRAAGRVGRLGPSGGGGAGVEGL